ncbi:nuclear body protein SP140-like protein [Sturnira hondurensis]|uniref:nuclear body protein SP140-like protein n=1 Tax=Sturnira hondurensis TaxID=192404 RepID=UPI001879C855|nr:nuclear body protein SP140-like protein [Sturnira hondurensis]
MSMASGGRDLSSRMSAEAQNIDNSIERVALRLFKMHKVEISQAIKESYPLLQLLHDHDFITSEMYDVCKESFKKGHNVEEVVYDILFEVEKKFEPSLLKILFNKFTMKKNPGLSYIYEIFKNEIPDKNFFPESEAEENKEMHDIQSSLEQVTINDDSAKCEDEDEPPKASTPAVKKKTGTGQQPDVPVNFHAELLPVTCNEMTGLLIKRKMERGTTTKCITKREICSFTLSEFEVKGGYKTSGDWMKRLRCGGRILEDLMKDRILPIPPRKHGANKKGEDSDKCKICQDGGKLFRCEKCHSLFHVHCHLPPVDTKSTNWNCTFCKINNLPRSQQRYRESEVLKKVMGPEEKLKCEFLLLKVYGHLEGNIFPNIPCENYVKQASHCLEKLRKLDMIKESVIEGQFPSVKSFMQAMDNFFTILKCNDAELIQDGFKKNFKDIFAIEETN